MLACAFACVAAIACMAKRALDAERTHQAYALCIDVLTKYAESHPRQPWPRSWNDLAEVELRRGAGHLSWPRDREKIERRVQIDFESEVETILQLREDEAILLVRPIGVSYGVDHQRISTLLDAMRLAESIKGGGSQ